ncbi:MAG: ribosome biogenesis GTPase Der [Peptococcaceae bacterium]|nr:ribosome biogenesis GTPase Der [Peptococcaceae bacterium]
MKPIVAIVGRPNVGKSTLFNRLAGGRHAIVEDKPGVTRDRLYRDATWLDHDFTVIDTGGIEFNTPDGLIPHQVKAQAEIAIEEANVVIFVVDGQSGLTDDDEEAAHLLRKCGKPVVLAVNKLDNFDDDSLVYEFYSLGLGDPVGISAGHGMNIGDLLDEVVKYFPDGDGEDYDPDTIKIAVIGRPNVGKSSLVNKILGSERVIVSNIPGTTRDAIDTVFEREGQEYVIIDTAGMRRRGKVNEPTEKYSVARSMKAIDRCDVVLMVLDAVDGITEQDKHVAGYAHEAGKGMLIVVNKWDLPVKDDKTMNKFEKKIKEEMAFLDYALSIFVSAKTGQRVDKILPIVNFITEQQNHRVPTARINELLVEAAMLNPPPQDKGKRLKLLYGTQVGVKPPKFVIFVNEPEAMHFSYERYLINQIRENFGFAGTPVWLLIRKREKEE